MPEAARSASHPTTQDNAHSPLSLKRPCACAASGQSCARCQGDAVIQRKSLDGNREPLNDVPESVRQTVARPGRGLDPGVRGTMESHFGTSFSNVRIHTDDAAANSASNINAAAYAFGNNVVFNRGYYRPESRFGQGLLAHELTHVLQQSRGSDHSEAIGPRHEHEADRAADALNGSGGSFHVSGCAAPGIGPLSFGELQKKVWAQVPDSAKPYLRPLAEEAKQQVEKVIPADAQVPAPVAEVIEHPVESARLAATAVAHKAKERVRDYAMEQAGTIKGVVMEGTSLVDTLVWAGYETGKGYGLVDRKTQAPTISDSVGGGIDKAVEAGEKKIFGDLPPEQALVFNSYEVGELKGAIGSQVALGFVGVEEVQLALKAVGVLGSLRGLMLLLEKQGGADGWYKNPEFVGALVGVALSFLSLKSTKAANKIINIVLASGNLISAGPAVWKLYNDWKTIPESDPKREKTLKDDLGAVVKLIANIVVDIVRHKSGKPAADDKGHAPAGGDEPGSPASKPQPPEAAAASPHAERPAAETAIDVHATKPAAEPARPASEPVAAPTTAKPVDVGLADRGVRPAPGTRSQTKPEYKVAQSAARRNKRIQEAMERIDAEAARGAVDTAEPTAKPGGPEKAKVPDPKSKQEAAKPALAEHPADSTAVTKSEATAIEPTANGHEAVVTKRGVGVCSPAPCPVIHVEYAFELKQDPKLKARNDQIQAMRKTNPKKAVSLAAKLIKDLEGRRQAALDREFGDFQKLTGKGGVKAEGDILQMQPHGRAADYREAHGLQGRESAHLAAQALMKQVPGWSKGQALTLLLRSQDHRGATGMDHFWKNDMDALRARSPGGKASAKEMYNVFAKAVDRTNLPSGEKASIKARLHDEMFVDNRMNPEALFTIPRGYRK